MARKYLIETAGCQMNAHDSERMAGLLEQAGYEPTTSDLEADVVVLNTCSVRERAEEKLFTRLGELRQLAQETGHDPIVAVTGCVAQQEGPAILKRAPGVADVIVGTQAIRLLPMLVERAASERAPVFDLNPYDNVSFPLGVARRGDPVKAYVTIIEGCNEYCSFCVVPYTRGLERMRAASEILGEVREAVESGRREIQLLGQIVNHYRAPDRPGFAFVDLLAAVHEIPGVERIRFASPHPRHVSQPFLRALRGLTKVCRHLHLPVQSGSTRVLSAMRRRYTREQYLDLVGQIRSDLPEFALSTDMIVGFPGETARDFSETLSLTVEARYHSMFSFKYSPRPHTAADKRFADAVSEPEKTARIVELQALQRGIQSDINASMVGRDVEVLVDGASRRSDHELTGRTSQNVVVNVPGSSAWIGRTLTVRIDRSGPHSVRGTVVNDAGPHVTGPSCQVMPGTQAGQ